MAESTVTAHISAKDDGLSNALERIVTMLDKLNSSVEKIGKIMIQAQDAGASKVVEQVKERVDDLSHTKAETELAANDRAGPKIEEVKAKTAQLSATTAEPTIAVKDNATSKVETIENKVDDLSSAKAEPVIEAKDKATEVVNRIDKTTQKLINGTNRLVVDAKDNASNTVNKVGKQVGLLERLKPRVVIDAIDKASGIAQKAGEKIRSLASKVTRPTIDANDSPFNQKVNSVREKLSALSNATGTIAFGFLQSAGQKAFNALGGSIDGAISRYDTLQQFPKVMSQMGYSAADAKDNVDRLSEGIDGLPTTLDGIVKNAQNLTLTLGNMNKGTDTAIAFNNAMLASGAGTEEASMALTQYTQMLANGKVDMQSWTSMQTAGKYALTEVAKKLGIASGNTQELYDKLQSGTISLDEFNDALIDVAGSGSKMAKTARTAVEGIGTSLKNLANAGKKGMANLFTQIDAELAKGGTSMAAMIDSMKGAIDSGFKGAGQAVTVFAEAIRAVDFSAIAQPLATLGSSFQTIFQSMLSSGAVSGIVNVFTKLATVGSQAASSIAQAFTGIDWSFLSGVVAGLTAKFKAGIQVVGKFFDKMKETGTMDRLTTAFGKIGDAVATAFDALASSGALDTIINGLVKVIDFAAQAATAISDFISKMDSGTLGNITTGIVGAVAAFKAFGFLKNFNPLQKFLKLFKKGTDETQNESKKTKGVIEQVFDGIGKVIKSVGTAISTAAKGIGKGLSTAFKGLATASQTANPVGLLAISAAILAVGAACAMVASQGEGIGAIIASIGTAFANAAPAIEAVGTAIGLIVSAVAEGLATVLTAVAPYVTQFAEAFSICSDAIAEAVATIITAITPLVDVVMQNFNQLVQIVTDAIVQIVAALGPYIPAVTEMVETVATQLPILVDSFSNLLSEISPIIDSIGDTFEDLGDAIKTALDGVSDVIDSVGDVVKTFFDGLSGVIDSIGEAALNAGKGFDLLANGIKTITGLNLLDMAASLGAVATGIGLIAGASAGLGDAGTQIKDLGAGLMLIQASATGAIAAMENFGSITTQLQQVGATAPQVLQAADAITQFAVSTMVALAGLVGSTAVLSVLTSSLSNVGSVANSAAGSIRNAASSSSALASAAVAAASGLGAMSGAAQSALAGVTSAITAGMGKAVQAVVTGTVKMVATMVSTVAPMMAAGKLAGLGAASGLKTGMAPMASYARSACTSAVAAMQGYYGRAYAAGSYIGQGLANGLSSQVGNVAAQAARLASAADAAIRAKAKIGSPSKVQYQNGVWMVQGMINGLKSMSGQLYTAAYKYLDVNDAVEPLSSGLEGGRLDINREYQLRVEVNPIVSVGIDGREFVRAAADPMKKELDRRASFRDKLKGER